MSAHKEMIKTTVDSERGTLRHGGPSSGAVAGRPGPVHRIGQAGSNEQEGHQVNLVKVHLNFRTPCIRRYRDKYIYRQYNASKDFTSHYRQTEFNQLIGKKDPLLNLLWILGSY